MKILKCSVCLLLIGLVIFACKEPDYNGQKASSGGTAIRTDSESINAGEGLFNRKCRHCHYANSSEILKGPGMYEILKKSRLPVSKRPATPENIINQLKNPYGTMPPFPDLTEEDVLNIIAFLNTL
jgi:mono/diheme cytochrome c family protein